MSHQGVSSNQCKRDIMRNLIKKSYIDDNVEIKGEEVRRLLYLPTLKEA